MTDKRIVIELDRDEFVDVTDMDSDTLEDFCYRLQRVIDGIKLQIDEAEARDRMGEEPLDYLWRARARGAVRHKARDIQFLYRRVGRLRREETQQRTKKDTTDDA